MNERESDYPDPDLRAGAGVRSQGAKDGPKWDYYYYSGWCVPPAEPTVSARPLSFYAGSRLVPPGPGPAVLGWPRLLRMSGSTRGKLLPLPSLV